MLCINSISLCDSFTWLIGQDRFSRVLTLWSHVSVYSRLWRLLTMSPVLVQILSLHFLKNFRFLSAFVCTSWSLRRDWIFWEWNSLEYLFFFFFIAIFLSSLESWISITDFNYFIEYFLLLSSIFNINVFYWVKVLRKS